MTFLTTCNAVFAFAHGTLLQAAQCIEYLGVLIPLHVIVSLLYLLVSTTQPCTVSLHHKACKIISKFRSPKIRVDRMSKRAATTRKRAL